MPVRFILADAVNETAAKITSQGEILSVPNPSMSAQGALTVINTAVNFIVPMEGFTPVLTGMILTATKEVSPTDGAVVDIYEADALDSTSVATELYLLTIARLGIIARSGLFVLVSPGVWVNAKTDDASVNVTLEYFYRKIGV